MFRVLFSLLFCSKLFAQPLFRITEGTAQVFEDRLSQYLPICADRIDSNVISNICAQQGGLLVKSYNKTSHINILSASVRCNGNECFSSRRLFCNQGLNIECGESMADSGCPKEFVKLGKSKCLGIISDENHDYEEAVGRCRSFHNSSLASLGFIDTKKLYLALKELNKSRNDVHLFLTSAVRMRRDWRWSDGIMLDKAPEGEGRCMALQLGDDIVAFKAMECSLSQFVPLCEINLAQNCALPGEYQGDVSHSISGTECLKWNDPRITQHGYFSTGQRFWDHNSCRIVNGNGLRPWCMISDQLFEECQVPKCNVNELSEHFTHNVASQIPMVCKEGEVKCGQSDECVDAEFICDYEMDCSNGFDESNCRMLKAVVSNVIYLADFLENFDLKGEFKLVDEVSEVWTNIRRAQGCAQRCIQNPEFTCESFSFDPDKEICLLSRISNNPAVLFERPDSFYYQKKFSKDLLTFTQNSTSLIIEASKNGQKGPICMDNVTQTDQLCKEFGFGPALNYPVLFTSRTAHIWSIESLRNDVPDALLPLPSPSDCRRFLRCSNCLPSQFSCQLEPACIDQNKVCDGRVDCNDASDEIGCRNIAWRLIGEVEDVIPEGRVQLSFQNKWTDVCSDGLNEGDVSRLCSKLGKGKYGRILPIYGQKSTSTTWLIRCDNEDCGPLRMHQCLNGILNLRCDSDEHLYCGHRFSKARIKRVVGGFDSAMGAFPWTAALRFNYGDVHHCGAVIIAERYLLSAAHCFEANREPKDFTVITGDWNNRVREGTEQKFNISKIHFFPNYEDLFQHDIVLLEISNKIRFDQYSQPICLPPRGYRYNKGQVCIVSGWGSNGTEYSEKMRAAAMPILDRDECRNVSKIYSSVSKTSFCAGYLNGGIDSCQGDSGGPFACEHNGIFYLGGIISWGEGCAQKKHPGIYTMITPYLSWIENITTISF
uniref:Neurotrypsin n=1 Tax=Bursaphelenchus xylophilus TaxID=6326 RepID=A0A1I7RHA2_BURXY